MIELQAAARVAAAKYLKDNPNATRWEAAAAGAEYALWNAPYIQEHIDELTGSIYER